MTLNILFGGAVLLHAVLLLATFKAENCLATWLVRALLLGLIYDNLMLALGPFYIDAEWYYSASWLRYCAHVFVLPPLVVAAASLASTAGVGWAGRPAYRFGAILFAIAAIAFGFVTEIAGLELVRESLAGHVRFVSAEASPPIATIVTNFVLMAFAVAIWRKAGWPWLFAASLTILLVNGGLAGSDWGIVGGNVAELLFAAAWVLTLVRFRGRGEDS